VTSFLEKYRREFQKPVTSVSDEAMHQMTRYRWPGNVRELQNVIERAILITESEQIGPADLPESMRASETFQMSSLKNCLSIEDYTKAFILEYQRQYNEQQLSAMLGITRKSLWEKRKKWGIEKSQTNH
jgi:two-component system response regulator PilR (NtrC family)